MAKFNGQLVITRLNGTPLAHETEAELSISQELLDATTKDSGNWTEDIVGNRSATITVSGLIDYSSSFGVDELADMIINAASANFVFSTGTSGDTKYSGTVNLSDLTQTMNNNDVANFSGTLKVTGVLTKATEV